MGRIMVKSRLWSFKFKGSFMIKLVIVRQGWVLYELCLSLSLERMIGVEFSGFVALIYGLHIYRDGYESVAMNLRSYILKN